MIWKLIRYSPVWKIAGWASLIYSAVWLVLPPSNANEIFSLFAMLYMVYRVSVVQAPEITFRCTFFDAALPVDGRDLWVAKMIVLLGMVWLPALAMSAVGFVLFHNPALPFLNGAAGLTAILLAAQSFRIHEFHEPLLVRHILLFAGGTAIILLAIALPRFAMRVLAGYLMANVAFFLLAWSRVPQSFTVAPTAAKSSISFAWATQGTSSPMRAWWKILRQIYLTYLLVPVGLGWLLGGASLTTMVFTVPILTATARTSWGFLAHLPVSPRKLFWAIWAPLPLAMFLGYEAALHFPLGRIRSVMLGPRLTAIDWAITLILLLSWTFFFQFWTWRRIRRVPVAVQTVLIAAGMTAAWIAIPDRTVWSRYGADPIPYFAVKWAAALPENPWMLAVVLMVPLAGLFWLVERAFCEMEYSTTRTIGESYYQAR